MAHNYGQSLKPSIFCFRGSEANMVSPMLPAQSSIGKPFGWNIGDIAVWNGLCCGALPQLFAFWIWVPSRSPNTRAWCLLRWNIGIPKELPNTRAAGIWKLHSPLYENNQLEGALFQPQFPHLHRHFAKASAGKALPSAFCWQNLWTPKTFHGDGSQASRG